LVLLRWPGQQQRHGQNTGVARRHDNPDTSKKGSVWVRFSNGHEAPLEAGQTNAAALG
jgi:hypothetical protein